MLQKLAQQTRHPGLDLSSAVLDLEQQLADLRQREDADQAKLGFLFGPQVLLPLPRGCVWPGVQWGSGY